MYLLPLQGLIVLFLTSQMKASLINENCGVVEACKKQREKRKKFSMGGGYTWKLINFLVLQLTVLVTEGE